jgi:glycosyltransferase involved in cell wall biosynthesis
MTHRRLLIDVTDVLQTKHKAGIQRVVLETCKALLAESSNHDVRLIYALRGRYFSFAKIVNNKIIRKSRFFPEKLKTFSSHDIILRLDYSNYFLKTHKPILARAKQQGAKIITVVYDLIPIKYPAFSHETAPKHFVPWLRYAIEISDGFLCISQSVATELRNLIAALQQPSAAWIDAWRLGANNENKPVSPIKSNQEFLIVGTLEPRKNHKTVVLAFEKLWSTGFTGTLTIIGRRGWNEAAIVNMIKQSSEYGHKLLWHENADDALLQKSYEKADVLISASYAEGFGLPLIEAAQYGCQILASDIPVYREVLPPIEAAIFFDPESVENLVSKIQNVQARATVKSDLSFNWHDSARELLRAMEKNLLKGEEIPQKTIEIISQKQASEDFHLQLIDIEKSAAKKHFIIKISNASPTTFYGEQHEHAVCLGSRIYSQDGRLLHQNLNAAPIPLLIAPEDIVFVSSTAALEVGQAITFQLFQKGKSWFGPELTYVQD